MNAREQWYAQYRIERIERRKSRPLGLSALTSAFKEYYGHILPERLEVEKELILRYRGKVSRRLSERLSELRAIGKKNADDMIGTLINAPNPFLNYIRSDSGFRGSTLPVPIRFNQ